MIYSIIAITFCFLVIIINTKSNWLLLVMSLLSALVVIQFDNLPDNEQYQYLYSITPQLNYSILYGQDYSFNNVYGEILYKLSMSLSKYLSLDYSSFRFVTLIWIVYSKIYFIKKFTISSIEFSLGVLVYFGFFFFADAYLLRQSIASGLLCFAIVYIFESKYVWSIMCIFFACGFHTSSLIASVFLVCKKIKFPRCVYILIVCAYFVIGFNDIKEVLNNYSAYLFAGDISNRIDIYYNNIYGNSVGLFRGSVLLFTFLYLFGLQKIDNCVSNYRLIYNVATISLFFLLACNSFGVIADRGFRLISMSFLIIVPIIYRNNISRKNIHLPILYISLIISSIVMGINN